MGRKHFGDFPSFCGKKGCQKFVKNCGCLAEKHHFPKKKKNKRRKQHCQHECSNKSFSYLCRGTTHHLKPTSRGGTNNKRNKMEVPLLRHNAWHLLFQNLTPEEIKELIKNKSREEITENKKNRQLAWEIIFGYWETSLEEKIKIIEKYWMPQEEVAPAPN